MLTNSGGLCTTRVALSALALLATWMCSTFVAATTTTPLGREMRPITRVLATRAVVVAELVQRSEGADVSYLVFENQRVVYGSEERRLLVFPKPELSNEGGGAFRSVLPKHIDQLREGELYLLFFAEWPNSKLAEWRPLDGADDALIEKQLASYAETKKCLNQKPWQALKDADTRACPFAYYTRFATTDEVNQLLGSYAELDQPSKDEHWLVYRALDAGLKRVAPPADLLVRAYRQVEHPQDGTQRLVQARLLELMQHAFNDEIESLVLRAVDSKSRDARIAALRVLTKHKVSQALPAIRKAMAGIPSEYNVAYERNLAAEALHFQIGPEAVDEVLAMVHAAGPTVENVRVFSSFLRSHAGSQHVPKMREIDFSFRRQLHAEMTELLVFAGDRQAAEEFTRLVKEGTIKRLPYASRPRVLQRAELWQPAAQWILANASLSHRVAMSNAVEILLHLGDPRLPDLLARLTRDDFFGVAALRYLVFVAEEEHRAIFQQYVDADAPEVRVAAWAGLTQLGDESAKRRFARIAVLGTDRMARYHARKDLLPRMNKADVIRAVRGAPPPSDRIAAAVHAHVLSELMEIEVDPRTVVQSSAHLRKVAAIALGVTFLLLVGLCFAGRHWAALSSPTHLKPGAPSHREPDIRWLD